MERVTLEKEMDALGITDPLWRQSIIQGEKARVPDRMWLHALTWEGYYEVEEQFRPSKTIYSVAVQPVDIERYAAFGMTPDDALDACVDKLAWRLRKIGYIHRLSPFNGDFIPKAKFVKTPQTIKGPFTNNEYYDLKLTFGRPDGPGWRYTTKIDGGRWRLLLGDSLNPIGEFIHTIKKWCRKKIMIKYDFKMLSTIHNTAAKIVYEWNYLYPRFDPIPKKLMSPEIIQMQTTHQSLKDAGGYGLTEPQNIGYQAWFIAYSKYVDRQKVPTHLSFEEKETIAQTFIDQMNNSDLTDLTYLNEICFNLPEELPDPPPNPSTHPLNRAVYEASGGRQDFDRGYRGYG